MSYLSKDFIKNLLLTIIIGFAAGALGAVSLWSMLLSYRTEIIIGGRDRPTLLTRRGESVLEAKTLEIIREQVVPSIVDFWNAPSGSSERGTFYLPEDAVGHGIVLTTDGWIVAHESVLPRDRSAFRVGVGPAVVKPISYLLDTETGALFVKIQAANLNAARFASAFDAQGANQFYTATGTHNIHEVAARLVRAEGVVVSDTLLSRYEFSRALSADLLGAPLIDRTGDVVGMVVAPRAALPVSHITSVLRGLLADGKLIRPALGVRGVQLAGARIEGSGRERGFLLRNDPRTGARAVARKSPAEAAGLKEGDSILKINETIVNGELSLADLLLAFRPGDTVDLRIARGTEELVISVTLGERQSGKSL